MRPELRSLRCEMPRFALRARPAGDVVACRDERRSSVAFNHDSPRKKTHAAVDTDRRFVEPRRCRDAVAANWRELHTRARTSPRKDYANEAQITGPHAGPLAFRIARSPDSPGAAGIVGAEARIYDQRLVLVDPRIASPRLLPAVALASRGMLPADGAAADPGRPGTLAFCGLRRALRSVAHKAAGKWPKGGVQ